MGTAVILDNLATHQNKEAAAALKIHGCWLFYPPPYSPDRTGLLPRVGARSFRAVFDATREICGLYDPKECWNYFKVTG